MTAEDREFLAGVDADVQAAIDRDPDPLADLFDERIRADQTRDSEARGERQCPGQYDEHSRLFEEPCPLCGAAL